MTRSYAIFQTITDALLDHKDILFQYIGQDMFKATFDIESYEVTYTAIQDIRKWANDQKKRFVSTNGKVTHRAEFAELFTLTESGFTLTITSKAAKAKPRTAAKITALIQHGNTIQFEAGGLTYQLIAMDGVIYLAHELTGEVMLPNGLPYHMTYPDLTGEQWLQDESSIDEIDRYCRSLFCGENGQLPPMKVGKTIKTWHNPNWEITS